MTQSGKKGKESKEETLTAIVLTENWSESEAILGKVICPLRGGASILDQ